MLFWVFLHTLMWNGKAKSNSDLPFPFNIAGIVLDNNPQVVLRGRTGLDKIEDRNDFYQTEFDGQDHGLSNVDKSYFPEKHQRVDEAQEKLNSQSLLSVSANGLYNFLVKPENSAFNLILELSFVSKQLPFLFGTALARQHQMKKLKHQFPKN